MHWRTARPDSTVWHPPRMKTEYGGFERDGKRSWLGASEPRVRRCSPDYAKRRGLPSGAAELTEHDAIDYALVHAKRFWQFEDEQGAPVSVAMRSRIVANNGEAIRDMAIAGLGIASLPIFLAVDALKRGQLMAIPLELTQRPYVISALYPNTSHVSAKVRTFIDHLVGIFAPSMPWER